MSQSCLQLPGTFLQFPGRPNKTQMLIPFAMVRHAHVLLLSEHLTQATAEGTAEPCPESLQRHGEPETKCNLRLQAHYTNLDMTLFVGGWGCVVSRCTLRLTIWLDINGQAFPTLSS